MRLIIAKTSLSTSAIKTPAVTVEDGDDERPMPPEKDDVRSEPHVQELQQRTIRELQQQVDIL